MQTGKRESRRQASEAQREKKTKETFFLLGEQHENFIAAVIKCEMLAAPNGGEKKVKETDVRHFFQKRCNKEVSGSFTL